MLLNHWPSVMISQPAIDPDPITVEPDCPLIEAIDQMQRSKARCLWVVNHGQLVGVVSDREIRWAGQEVKTEPVAAVMTPPPTLSEAAARNPVAVLALMQQHPIDAVAVVDAGNHLLGVITTRAVLQALRWDAVPDISNPSCCSLFKNSIEGIFQTTLDGSYLSVNPTLAKMHGYDSPQEMMAAIGNIAQQLYVEPDRRHEFIRLIDQNGIVQGFESQVYRKDGSTMWISENAWLVRDAGGTKRYYEGTSIDISDRKRLEAERQQAEQALQASELKFRQLNADLENRIAQRTAELTTTVEQLRLEMAERQWVEAALQESEERLRLALEGAELGMWDYDLISGQSIWTNRCKALFDLPAAAHITQDLFLNAIHPDDRPRVDRAVRQAIANQKDYKVNMRSVWRDGSVHWIATRGTAYRDQQGRPARLVGIAFDISVQRQAEEALRQSEARLQRLAANVPGMIYQYIRIPDGSCTISYLSPACREIYEVEPEIGPQTADLLREAIHPDDLAAVMDSVSASFETLTPWQAEYRIITASGRLKWVKASSRPEPQADGSVVWDGIVVDITKLKETEEALRQSEARYRSLVTAASSIVARADGEGAMFEALLWESFTGQAFEDFRGFGWLRAVHPDDRQFVFAGCAQARRSKRPYAIEYRLLHHSGSYRYVTMQTVPMLNPDGSVREWIGAVTDINQRKQAEAALRESEERFRQIAEHINQFFFIRSAESRQFLYVSPAYEQIWGLSCESLYEDPESWLKFVHPDDRSLVQQSLKHQFQGQPTQREYRIIKADGSIRWVVTHLFPVLDETGQVSRFAGLAEDITDRKLAEAALRQSEERLRSVLNQMPVMLDVFGPDGNIVFWNQECERVTGYTAAEIIGNPDALEWLYPDPHYRQLMLSEWKNRQHNYRNWEWNITCKDGTVKTIAWSNLSEVVPILGWFSWGIGVDVSDRNKAEAEILNALEQERQLNELKSQFISMVSHEFRTPLSIILSSTELLQHYSHRATPQQQENRYRRIFEAIDRMTQLVDAVLLIGKAEAGKLPFNPAPLHLAEFCQELLEELRLSSKQSHRLRFNGESGPLLWLDRQLLRHILTNLISNAIKYSAAGSEVQLSLIHQEQTVILQVSDRGIGISAEDQQQLFTIFKRGANVGTISGTGLGLAIVKQCVELHKGSIAIASELGIGTVVTVTLPARKVSDL